MSESPAETMRRAAALMRERAEATNPGPWKSWIEGRDHQSGDDFIMTGVGLGGPGEDIYVSVSGREHNNLWNADQDYIASMHPLVALAVAEWLERDAALVDAQVFPRSDPAMERYPLGVARAYLGEEAGDG